MNIFTFASILAFSTGLSLATFVYLKQRNNPANKTFAMLTIMVSSWCLVPFAVKFINNIQLSLFYVRILHLAAVFVPTCFLRFANAIIGEKEDLLKKSIIISYIISFVFLIFIFSPFFILSINLRDPNGSIVAGPLYYVFTIFFGIMAIYGFLRLFNLYRRLSGYRKNQLRYILIATVFAVAGGFIYFYSNFFRFEPFPHDFLIIIYFFAITYAIVRYRLMDITVAITRTGIFVAVYTLVLGLPFAVVGWFKPWLIAILGANWWIVPLGLMAVLATVGPFIYIFLERKAEERLLREQRRYQNTLKQASIGMTRIRNLRKLLNLIVHIVTKTVRISYAAIYLYNEHTDEYVLQVSRDKGRMPVIKLNSDNPLITWLTLKRQSLVYEEVKRQMQDTNDAAYQQLEENMRLLTASVVIPSFLEDRFMGFIVLGEKLSGKMYTSEDLNVFAVLASQAALAIENAQFIDEAKEMQEQIAQAEKMATIGTMSDGLSHQINNRLHALSLIAGDTIDTIKITDTSQCTPEVKEMVKQINYALSRIQVNVMQGAEVVQGLLKYSRRGESGFEPLTLDQILDGTLEMVQFKVKLSEIDIIRNYPKDIPKIKGNLAQLEEVFFNFIDNAYDATEERRSLLNEEGYRGRITVSAQAKDDNLEIIVEDNGMGIKDEDTEKIFTPFFTTKISSRKGTGLGLYVIHRIITDTHKGKINFESAYKVGTRFILELPIAK